MSLSGLCTREMGLEVPRKAVVTQAMPPTTILPLRLYLRPYCKANRQKISEGNSTKPAIAAAT